MRVRFIVSDPAIGANVPYGDSIRVRLLIEALERLGLDLDVCWARPAAIPAPGPVGTVPKRRVPAPLLQLVRDTRSVARAARFVPNALVGERPDLVFEFASYLAPAGMLAARRFRVPYVVEVEGPLSELRYDRGGVSLRPVGNTLEHRRLRAAAGVVTVSHPLADRLIAEGAPRDRTSVIPNAADTVRFKPDPRRRANIRERLGLTDRVVVGFHGVFSPWYRLDSLVAAVAGRAGMALLLVGDGVERERIEDEIRVRGAGDQVVVTGFVPHDEVPGYVDAFDVGVVPDHAWWTSPLKLFEYGAMHKPVVALRVPSVVSLATEAEVRFAEEGSLGLVIEELARDAEDRTALAANWAKRVAAEYSFEQLVSRLGAMLAQTMARGSD